MLVEFGMRPCGPTDLAPGQSTRCHYDTGGEGVSILLGRSPRMKVKPDAYVMGGRPTAHRLTLEADGGMTFQCLSGRCASDGGALDPVHVVPRTDTPSPPPPIAPDGGPSSPGSQPGADAGPAPSTVRVGDERRLSD